MNAELLLTQFNRISDAQGAVPRLRQFILDLAVRGKLVEQDANDEPALDLLKRIEFERRRLARTAGLKLHTLPQVDPKEVPFDLPFSWEWMRVGWGFQYDAGTKREPKELLPDRWLLELEDIEKDTSVIQSRLKVKDRDSRSTKSEFKTGDVLYGKLRPYLNKVVVANEDGYSTTEIVAIRPFVPMSSSYCCLAFRRPDFVAYVSQVGRGTKMPRLRTEDALVALFPVPPVAEQDRIVAKVDELMALCDRLEGAQSERESRRDRLTAATHYHLSNETDAEAFRGYTQYFIGQLPRLTTHPDQLNRLRKSILNLAVTGRLVAQQGADSSATELLGRTNSLPAGYKRRRKILKESSIAFNDDLFPPIPSSWQYQSVQSLYDLNVIFDYADGNHGALYPRANEFGDSGVFFVTAKDLSNGKVTWNSCAKLNEKRAGQLPKGWAQGGDVLLTHNATVGRVARVEPEVGRFLLGTSVTFYRLNNEILKASYFFYFLQSQVWQGQLEAIMQQTTRNQVSIQKQAFFQVAIPPLAEQHRIVTKIDELMALCDQLEARLTIAQTETSHLLESVLHNALHGQDESELAIP